MRIAIVTCFFMLFSLIGCKQSAHVEESFDPAKITTTTREVNEIIYSMYLPTDLADVLDETGTNYDAEVPATIENYTLYKSEEQIAVMLGIYGADMMYMKLLGQIPSAAAYFQVIKNLAGKTDIPNRIFEGSIVRLEDNFTSQDSIAAIITDIYAQTNAYFNKNGKKNLSSLSLLGGWIETMYIGVSMLQKDQYNTVMAEKILQQKYSLNTIYTMMRNHQGSLVARKYLLLIKKLRQEFDKVEIKYPKNGFNVDTSNRKIQSGKAEITYSEDTLKKITTLITLIRNEIIKAE